MYSPNCAAQIEETQKYCRSCGTDVSLVSQALKGQLPSRGAAGIHLGHSERLRERRREDKKPPSIEGAIQIFSRVSASYSLRSLRGYLRPPAKSGGSGFSFPPSVVWAPASGNFLNCVNCVSGNKGRSSTRCLVNRPSLRRPHAFPKSLRRQPRIPHRH